MPFFLETQLLSAAEFVDPVPDARTFTSWSSYQSPFPSNQAHLTLFPSCRSSAKSSPVSSVVNESQSLSWLPSAIRSPPRNAPRHRSIIWPDESADVSVSHAYCAKIETRVASS